MFSQRAVVVVTQSFHRKQPVRHQVIELPPVQVQVSEYRLHAVDCPCGQTTRAKLPKGVSSGHFGPNLVAFVGLLTGVYHVSRRETVSFLGQWLGVKISLGGLSKVESRLSQALQEPERAGSRPYSVRLGISSIPTIVPRTKRNRSRPQSGNNGSWE